MISAHVPGGDVRRDELVRHLRQIDGALKEGVLSPEFGNIYRSYYDPVKDHRRFAKNLKKFEGATIDDIYDRCEARKTQLDRAAVKWSYDGNRKITMGCVGGAAAIGGGIAAISLVPNAVGGAVGAAAIGVGIVAIGYWLNRGMEGSYWYTDKKKDVESFQHYLTRWGSEINGAHAPAPAPAAPPMSSPAPQPRVDPQGPVIDSLSPEEKRKLAQQLIDQAQAEESRKPRTVEVGSDSVKVDGVSVPVRK